MNVASTKAAGTKIRLQIIGQKILAHLSPEAGDLRVHWLATTRSLVTVPKNNGHERRSTRTSGVTTTYRDRIRQRYLEGIDVALLNMGSPKPISKGSGANFRNQRNDTLGNITRLMRRELHSKFRAPFCL
jgi:hypothetical protein